MGRGSRSPEGVPPIPSPLGTTLSTLGMSPLIYEFLTELYPKNLSVPVLTPPHMYQVLFGLLVEKDDDIPCHGCIFFTFIAVGEGGGRIIGYELFWSRLNGGGRT